MKNQAAVELGRRSQTLQRKTKGKKKMRAHLKAISALGVAARKSKNDKRTTQV